jgi:hypothetical protein
LALLSHTLSRAFIYLKKRYYMEHCWASVFIEADGHSSCKPGGGSGVSGKN